MKMHACINELVKGEIEKDARNFFVYKIWCAKDTRHTTDADEQ